MTFITILLIGILFCLIKIIRQLGKIKTHTDTASEELIRYWHERHGRDNWDSGKRGKPIKLLSDYEQEILKKHRKEKFEGLKKRINKRK